MVQSLHPLILTFDNREAPFGLMIYEASAFGIPGSVCMLPCCPSREPYATKLSSSNVGLGSIVA